MIMNNKDIEINKNVNMPDHYRMDKSGVETIDITRWLNCDLANSWKYLMRYKYKGNPKQDCKKAIWYLKDYINNNVNLVCDISYAKPDVKLLMEKVIEHEEVKIIAQTYHYIYKLYTEGVNLKLYNKLIADLEEYSETL